jgi:hypothetical protein
MIRQGVKIGLPLRGYFSAAVDTRTSRRSARTGLSDREPPASQRPAGSKSPQHSPRSGRPALLVGGVGGVGCHDGHEPFPPSGFPGEVGHRSRLSTRGFQEGARVSAVPIRRLGSYPRCLRRQSDGQNNQAFASVPVCQRPRFGRPSASALMCSQWGLLSWLAPGARCHSPAWGKGSAGPSPITARQTI